MNTLGDNLPKEIARCEALIVVYEGLGAVGQFGKILIQQVIDQSKQAIKDDDIVKMITCYQKLKNCK